MPSKTHLKFFFCFVSFLWMAFIFFLSSRSTIGIGQTQVSRFLILKTFHLIEYSLLFIFYRLALGRNKPAVVLAYLYAASDEFHQSLVPGREGRFLDTFIDLVGIFIGVFVYRFLLSRFALFRNL